MSAKFVNTFLPYSRQAVAGTNINELLPLIVAYLESGAGTNTLAREANNLHSIKAGSTWKGPKFILVSPEYRRGQKVQESSSFRRYATAQESFNDFVKLLNLPRYNAVRQASTLMGQITALAAAGYATDPAYKTKLESIAAAVRKVARLGETNTAGYGASLIFIAGGAYIVYKLVKRGKDNK